MATDSFTSIANRPPAEPFSLSEYESAGTGFFSTAMRALMRSKDPILGQIQVEEVAEVATGRVSTTAAGGHWDVEPMTTEADFAWSVKDLTEGDFDGFYVAVDQAAQRALESLMPQVFARVAEICAATGQTVDAQGKPFSYELLLEMLRKVEIRFTEDGSPVMPTLVVSPEMVDKIRRLPPPTMDQTRALEQLIDEKRRVVNARRRSRQLPQRTK